MNYDQGFGLAEAKIEGNYIMYSDDPFYNEYLGKGKDTQATRKDFADATKHVRKMVENHIEEYIEVVPGCDHWTTRYATEYIKGRLEKLKDLEAWLDARPH